MLLYVTEPIVPDVSKYCIVFVFRVRLSKKTGLFFSEDVSTAPLRNIVQLYTLEDLDLHLKMIFTTRKSGFVGLEVACWPLVPKFAGSHPAEAFGFLGRKNPQHVVGLMS
jgi:hypothetical protein